MALNGQAQQSAAPEAKPAQQTVSQAQRTMQGGLDYTKGSPIFPNVFAPYRGKAVPSPNYTNSPRIDDFMKDGKLTLSLNDAIALGLENNLDLSIARYNLSIADTEILRTKSGANTQGVNTGVVQGTLGGSSLPAAGASGGGAGGTSSGSGGAGTGTGGIVTSTLGAGPATPQFDPIVTSTLSLEHSKLPVSSVQTAGSANINVFNQNTDTANFTYNQGFATGTNFAMSFNNSRLTTNSVSSFLNPAIGGSVQFKFTQHLLQGFGIEINKRFMRIAKNNREISDIAFRQQVITTVAQIENIYWNLVNAYEDVKAKQRALDLTNRLLGDNQKQVQIGTLAPIEVIRAQSGVASASQDLIVSQTNLELQELFMKNAISRNLTDSKLVAAAVIPTDTMLVPEKEPVAPVQDLITDALAHRPELAQAKIDLTNREINNRAARNGMRPVVDLVAWYGSSALAGMQNPNNFNLPVNAFPPTGLGDSFSNLFGTNYPDYAVGVSVNIPIRNRAAQATQIRSELEYRQAQMRMQQVENQIRVQVVNAQFTVQQNRARVDAATKGRVLALESLSAEQKKYALGASTTYNVMTAQRDLSTAESNLITAMAAYEQSKVAMDTATGLLLTNLGIELQDAVTGTVQSMPRVPNVVPAASVTAAPVAQPAQGAPTRTPPMLPPAPDKK